MSPLELAAPALVQLLEWGGLPGLDLALVRLLEWGALPELAL